MKTKRIPIPSPAPGHERFLTVHEFGQGEHKAYLQAGLHADEWPGMLALQHLMERLIALEADGQLTQRIVLVPYANPIGLNQRLFGKFPGRFDAVTGQNFNRGMAIDSDDLIDRVRSELSDDGEANDRIVRATLRQMVEEQSPAYEIEWLHRTLLGLSLDATVMLDLHCDYDAMPHVFYGDHQRDQGARLGDCLGFPIRLEEDVRGVVAFDGTHTQPWVCLSEATGKPFSRPCFAATLELRGQYDVSDDLARRDAEGILAFLESEGFVRDSGAEHQPPSGLTRAINVDQVKVIPATANGLVTYHKELGSRVETGDHLADIVVLDADGPKRLAVTAPTGGVFFSRTHSHLVYPGASLGMIASDERHIEPGQQLSFR
ncbi:succinylglutamate desuccinylase/aspartoacylase family protein [Saccharospirillum salsuginis]|uniref:Succinylglutamate desuccinylase n=1 Tax=Saccharospirillum salsuginis TaxID=418750 RepID=A0A918N698_9GAMM|nr:succinylglutamate desuccinylase/aspartoacylase family protein [Saccharospirillum salsuginis]GGX42068.1 succinylglutamate desuccinylase [Saccharospirillum salsuginis]